MPRSRSRSPIPRPSHRHRSPSEHDNWRRSRNRDREDRHSYWRDERRPAERGNQRRPSRRDDSRDRSPRQRTREGRRDDPSDEKKVARRSDSRSASPVVDKSKPNFAPSGLLAAATNTVTHEGGKTTLLKYNEPPEARKPTQSWRLYVFKGEEEDVLHISRQSAYLVGRDRLVADIPLEHPSCSKQHAAFQYRTVTIRDEFGSAKSSIKLFIIDLESTNGTHVNNHEIPPARYYELKSGDVIKFGLSTREYVILMDPDS